MIVVDASVVVEVMLQTDDSARATARILNGTHTLHAPEVIYAEVLQAIRRYARTGQVAPDRGRTAIDDLIDLQLACYSHEPLLTRAWELRDVMSAYDAMYVALAEALDAPLVTRDGRLARAVGHEARIEVID